MSRTKLKIKRVEATNDTASSGSVFQVNKMNTNVVANVAERPLSGGSNI